MKKFIIGIFIGVGVGLISVYLLKIIFESYFIIGWFAALITNRALDYYYETK